MCYSCSKLIDNEETLHTVAYLKEMKALHQVYVSRLVGVVPIAPFEAKSEIRAGILEATISLITKAGSPASFDVSAVVEGYEESINSIDPNFKVVVTASSGSVVHELTPVTSPSPSIQIIFNDEEANASADLAWQKMIEVGESVHIPTNDFKFAGSKLFEHLNEVIVGGTLMLTPGKRRLETCIYFVSDEAEFELAATESFMGKGSKQFDMEGSALNGFFTYRYYIHDHSKVDATYTFDVAGWLGQPINNLRHYHRIKRAYDFIVKYPKSRISVEVVLNGTPMRLWNGTHGDYAELFARLRRIVEIAECSKIIASKIPKQLRLKTLDLTLQDEQCIELYAQLFTGDVIRKLDYGESIFTARVDEIDSRAIKAFSSEEQAEVIIAKSPIIDFFGNIIRLPRMSKKVTCFDLVFFSSIRKDDRQSLWCTGRANNSSDSVISIAPYEIPLLCDDEDVSHG
ncbi:hypothetical protein JMN21_24615 [Pseudomonas syringae pv. actinidiae]|uniref:hypothetical protein n=1 Tax=Pseudomonas syringae TaxID=317 RepID=UPI0004634115|nr:hypothetical protein [Pseudomonas syringae]AYL17930.1 hypothetical protein D9N00_28265 [Pseudomonas syringae pv. actinidiae]AYL79206.1 hypothetical protein CN228_03975 [Pseudomonas syringae pv. actinidiae str. Shaanxi_M228]MBL3602558.1 hypothetical protein [Pseudomonas syringae pv. actinidiae]MBL3631898.1 hypothetical protein [Pseudomonas syringae pv. actinidiae]MBL3663818.1 hypothetical protein [Pseudomonas syringae pv. actinidiae]